MSLWASPIVVVKKHAPEGLPQQFHLCVNYRKIKSLLLAVTPATGIKKDTLTLIPLPKIDELFASLKGPKYFTALDLHSSYYHIKLDEESLLKSALTTIFCKFKFLRLTFGLFQGPDFFIQLILIFLYWTRCQGQGSGYLAYLDDILIYSKT